MSPTHPIIRKLQVKKENLQGKSPASGGAPSTNLLRGDKMRRRKLSSSARRNPSKKRRSQSRRKSKTTWADPTVPITKMSKRKRTKLNKNEMKRNSCWWFG